MQMDSLRIRLTLWFGGLALTGVVVAGTYVGSIATDELKAIAGHRLEAVAGSAAALLSENLRERQQEIQLLAQGPLFTDGDLSGGDVRRVLDMRKAAHGAYAWIGVTDQTGQILQATDGVLTGQNAGQRPWFQSGRTGNFFGDIHEAVMLAKLLPQPTSGQPLRFIDIATPVRSRDGVLRGVLSAHAPWEWVTETVSSAVRGTLNGTQAEVLLATQNGTILYPYSLVGTTQAPALPEQGYRDLIWPDGASYLTAAVQVDTGPASSVIWHVIVRQPRADAVAPVQALIQKLLALGLLGVILFAVIAYRFALRLSRPIEHLAAAAQSIEEQDRIPETFPALQGPAEIRQLNTAFRSMAESLLRREHDLASLNASLETLVAERTAELEKANQELQRLATHDALTGVLNRRRFDSIGAEQFALFQRSGITFTILLVDADHFKAVNDTYGHQAGDRVLQRLAGLLLANIRTCDSLARYGGEEFVLLLPETPAQPDGASLAERLCTLVAETPFPDAGRMTISIGLSQALLTDTSIADTIGRADTALYDAKRAGRNRAMTG